MKPRKRAGENTKILIRAINPTGSTLREATDASGLHDDAARSYMRRCEMRGLVKIALLVLLQHVLAQLRYFYFRKKTIANGVVLRQ